MLEMFDTRDWVENFRMKRETFNYLCDKLRPSSTWQDTQFRTAVSVEQKVAITLWCLATQCEYCTMAHLFGVARSTVCEVVQDTCRAIVHILLKTYIRFPTGDALKRVIDGFEDKWGYP